MAIGGKKSDKKKTPDLEAEAGNVSARKTSSLEAREAEIRGKKGVKKTSSQEAEAAKEARRVEREAKKAAKAAEPKRPRGRPKKERTAEELKAMAEAEAASGATKGPVGNNKIPSRKFGR